MAEFRPFVIFACIVFAPAGNNDIRFPIANADHEVPVLCYHHIKASAEGHLPDYTISIDAFEAQLQMLADSGYTSILPDQLYHHLLHDAPLPLKPVMITFDDTHEEHFSVAAPLLRRYRFNGVFFILTVCIGKKGYLGRAQIKALSDSGHVIAAHTYDHPDMRNLKTEDWPRQLNKPNKILEEITGKQIEYFAYPYGLWSDSAIAKLKKAEIKMAFQLAGKRSATDSLYTIRRIIVSGNWSGTALNKKVKAAFK
jgi:peptidoglycan/xylan/chitin deacetylase (PgdA/CDA1 family)